MKYLLTFNFTVFSACTKDRDVDMRSEIYTFIINMNSSLNQLQNIITHNCGGRICDRCPEGFVGDGESCIKGSLCNDSPCYR